MFDPAVYAARRDLVMQAIGPRGVLLVHSLPERLRNGDGNYNFRQHSDVLYLTGFVEPETVLVLRPGAETDRFVMFVRPRDPVMETWEGRRAGVEGAKEKYGADAAYPIAELAAKLPELITNCDELHFELGVDEEMDHRVGRAIARLRRIERKGKRPPRAVVDPRIALHELRLKKRPEEIETMRRACTLASEAHVEAMKAGRPGTHEYELEALIDYSFRRAGGQGPGYPTIVGSGANATILHYTENTRRIEDGDLVLIDAGAEYGYYSADITRTWPANGTFTPVQRKIYELVLATQEGAIALARPGATIDEIHDHCVKTLTAGMIELGLLTGTVEERIADEGYKKFYMHGTSHWLGLDVHDAGAYQPEGTSRPLEPGMVITIEPGLYIAADAEGVPEEMRGIGVRIEDDVLITNDGHDVLTAACPKRVEDIEAVLASR